MLLAMNKEITLCGKGVANYENNCEFCLIEIYRVIKEVWQISCAKWRKTENDKTTQSQNEGKNVWN